MNSAAVVPPTFALDALRLLQEGDVHAALTLAADGVRSYPTYVGGYVVLADCYSRLGAHDDATVILREAERRFPSRAILRKKREQEPLLESPAPESPESPTPVQPLRIISLSHPASDQRTIRSTTMRLIPGLEYTSLRFEGIRRSGRSVSALPEPPAFRSFHPTSAPSALRTPRKVSLEELASRIGKVRITAEELEKRPPAPDPLANNPRQAFVTETLATIYLNQKSYAQAIEAFTQLMERHPDRAAFFEEQRAKAQALLASSTS